MFRRNLSRAAAIAFAGAVGSVYVFVGLPKPGTIATTRGRFIGDSFTAYSPPRRSPFAGQMMLPTIISGIVKLASVTASQRAFGLRAERRSRQAAG